MLDQETKRRIDNARDILVGKVPDPKSQVEQITIALIYKFMDDMDETTKELGGNSIFFTGEFEKYSWSKIFDPKLSGHELIILYGEAITKMYQNKNLPQLFRDIFKNAFLPYRDPETLKSFLKEINEFKYDHSEKLGDAYEYLLSILSSQGDAGQFRTPRHIIDFIVSVIDPKKNETILDPACGTAGFLISSYKHILDKNTKERNGDLLTPDAKRKLVNNFVGYDISPDMVRLSLVNMYLHSFPDPKIHEYDTLTSEERWDELYDVILANPPFMTPKGGIRPHKRFAIQANRSEVLFVDYIMEHLTTNGRAGVIVPEGIIFQSGKAYKSLRKKLVDQNYLYAVVSLPAGIFQPYSGVKTSILLMDKNLAKKKDEIFFVKIRNDGYDLGAQRRPIDKNDLLKALEILLKYRQSLQDGRECSFSEEEGKISHIVLKSRISENGDYNLSGDRYIENTQVKNIDCKWVKIEEICDLVRGSSPRPKNDPKYYGGNVQRLMISDVTRDGMYVTPSLDFLTEEGAKLSRPMKKGEVVMAVSGNPGLPAILNVDACIHDGFVGFRNLIPEVLPEFLYFCLLHEKEVNNSQSVGAVFKNLTTSQIKEFEIPLLSLHIQKKIISEIESYQKIVNGAKQVVESYKPKIERDENWDLIELGNEEFFIIESGGTPSSKISEFWNGDIKWVTLEDIPPKNIITEIYDTKRTITELGLSKSSAKILPKNSILISSRATIGRIGISRTELATNQGFKNIVIKNVDLVDEIFLALTISGMVDEIKSLATGGTFCEISKSSLAKIKVPLPSIEIQKHIVDQIKKEQELVESNKKLIEIFEDKIRAKIADLW